MTEKKKQELTEDEKSELLYKLLFKDKVSKLGNLNVEQRDGYVVIDKGSNKNE
jgi:hypothetical protein